jgi:hypothetical protein
MPQIKANQQLIYGKNSWAHLITMKGKKIYYVPGIISLLLLPLLLYYYGPEEYERKTVVRLNLPYDHDSADENTVRFSAGYLVRQLKGKHITTITINNTIFSEIDHYVFTQKMAYIRSALEKLNFDNDTTEIVQILFTQESTYNDFIWVLNQAILLQFKRYAFLKNSIYFFADERFIPEDIKYEALDLYVQNDTMPVPPAPSRLQRLKWWFEEVSDLTRYYLRFNKLLICGFILLILTPQIILIRSTKNAQQLTKRPKTADSQHQT